MQSTNSIIPTGPALALGGALMIASLLVVRIWPMLPNTPEEWDLKNVKITLSRTGCLGDCPAYTVTLRSDGSVHFSGDRDVLIPGHHVARVSPSAVKELGERFERANFFAFKSKYVAVITDNPTYTLTLSVDGNTKTVKDYVGEQASMPSAITELENAVDEVAGTERWVKGNAQTLRSLEEEKWSFQSDSRENLNLYSRVVQERNQPLLERFLAEHAPIDSKDDSAMSPVCIASEIGDLNLVQKMMESRATNNATKLSQLVLNRCLANAAGSGNVTLVQFWLARGADARATPARHDTGVSGKSVLARSIASQNPAVVAEILKCKPDLDTMIDDTEPVLSYALELGQLGYGEKERVEIVEMLIKAGANVNARGRIRQTPIFYAIFTPGAVKPLIQAGADINARDLFGDTALIRNAYDEQFVKELLANGADPAAADDQGDTPLKRTDFCKECAVLIEEALKNTQAQHSR